MSEPHRQAVAALVELAPRLGRLITASLEAAGDDQLSLRQFRLLERLEREPERPGRLARGSDVGQPTVSAALASLESRGMVERVRDPSDGRASLCRLTPDGHGTLQRARTRLESVLAAVVEDLSDAEAAELARIIPSLVSGVARARERRRGEPSRAT
jgi:DNA-binding MarR family transcriptional regulator